MFAGRQEVPTIDPSVKYDWSIRMAQQSLYDALVKYVGNPPEIVPVARREVGELARRQDLDVPSREEREVPQR